MNDRSVQAGDISQSVVVTGDGNNVVLRFGKADDITVLERKQFRRPERRQQLAADQQKRELDLLKPEAGKFSFVGRDDLLAELRAWLDGEIDVSVHALTGPAGTGKTRLAIELCNAVDSDPAGKDKWIAGFLSPGFEEKLATDSFIWERQTLVVIDDAAQRSSALGRWLNRLANSQKLETKLRILLLDREAPEGFGWWHELTKEQEARFELFYAPRPTKLRGLSELEDRRRIMTGALEAACALPPPMPPAPVIPAAGEDANFDIRLADRQFGNPLALVMAGVIARDRGPRAALALRRLDAARYLGRRELDRLAALAVSRGLNGDTMRYIVAFNGLAGGLPLDGLRKTLADELAASRRTAEIEVLLELLQQELPVDAGRPVEQRRLATIQPDLLGEAAIIEAFTGQPSKEAEAPAAVRRAYALDPAMAAQALVRVVQDFGYAVEDKSATDAEKAAGQRVMDWLLALGREINDPIQLIPLVEVLPAETTILRETATELTDRISTFFRQEAERSNNSDIMYMAAYWGNNRAVRLSALGRREEALAAAEGAVRHYRALAEARPDAFTLNFARSLNTLATSLSALGRREEALAAAEESVRLRRALAEAHPDAFTPDLAMSLTNLGNRLSDLGRREDAFAAAEEAVRYYRSLAEARPEAFTPGLAMSLTNLASGLSDLGRREDALAAAEDAVRLYRALAEARPDAFTPNLATSINNLGNRLSDVGRHEDALAVGEEAVRLRRALAEARPDAFTPDLAMSLSNLANRLKALGRHEEALAAAEEAVRLRRALAEARPDAFTPDLAEARPDAFTPDLAMSLSNLANRLKALGRHEEALAAAEEAVRYYRSLAEPNAEAFTVDLARSLGVVGRLYAEGDPELGLSALGEGIERLTPIYEAIPAAVESLMRVLVQLYVTVCKAIGREPDKALLAPVAEVYERLKTQGEQS